MPIPLIVYGAVAIGTALGYGGKKVGEMAEKEARDLRSQTLDRLRTREMEIARKRKSLHDRLQSYADMVRSHLEEVSASGLGSTRKLPHDLQKTVDAVAAAVTAAGSFAPLVSEAQSAENLNTLARSYQAARQIGGPNGSASQGVAAAAAVYIAYEGIDKAISGHRNLRETKEACETAERRLDRILGGIQKAHDDLALQWDKAVVPLIPELQRVPVKSATVSALRSILSSFEDQISNKLWKEPDHG